jgi:hypothetical protein
MKPIVGLLLAFAACFIVGCNRDSRVPSVKVNEQNVVVPAEPGLAYSGPLEPLNAYPGKELAKLDEDQAKQLLVTIKKLIPEREYRHWFDFRPWYVWEFPNKGQPALVLFEVDNSGPHPGSTGIRINVFEKAKSVRSESVFWTGHRCYMRAVSLDKQADNQDPLIVLETGPGPGPGPNVPKQIYARVGNRFDLIRLEDSEGKATRNDYYVNHFACGPQMPKQTEAEWEADVLSADRLRVLRSLVWLGGSHWEGKPPDESEKQHEAAAQIQLVRSVRANKKVADKLRVLVESEDRWLREAAVLAADPKDLRW